MDTTPSTSLIRAFSSVTDEMPHPDKGGHITGLAVDRHQNILAVDNQAAVVKVFDQAGAFKYAFGDKVLKKPWDIFVTTSGKIAVSDPGEADVKVFSKSGKYLIRSEKGLHLNFPHGIDYQPWTKETVIADRGFSCVYVHDPKGNVEQMLTEQEDEKYCLGSPHYVCFDYTGNIFVTDIEDNSLVAYDTERKHLFTYGHPEADGTCSNELNNPAGVVVDRFGNILLADTGNCRVHLLDRNGKFKDYILTWEDGIGEPMAMALTEDGNLIISEANTGVIKIYSYMHLPYVIDTRVRTPEDGGDNYDIISIESGSTLKSDNEGTEDDDEGDQNSSLDINSTGRREASHKEFNQGLLALSASDPKRTEFMPKRLKEGGGAGGEKGLESGMTQWTHVRGEGMALEENGGIKGILKNSGIKPRFDFFTPGKNVVNTKATSATVNERNKQQENGDVVFDDKQGNLSMRKDKMSAYSRGSSTLPRSASSPKQRHSAGLYTREGTSAKCKPQAHAATVSKARVDSAGSLASLETSQTLKEQPIVIIDNFKSGVTIPRLNLLGKGGTRKSRKLSDKLSVSQKSPQSHHKSCQNDDDMLLILGDTRFPDELSSKKSVVSIDSLSSIGGLREADQMFEHYADDILDKDLKGFDAHDDNM